MSIKALNLPGSAPTVTTTQNAPLSGTILPPVQASGAIVPAAQTTTLPANFKPFSLDEIGNVGGNVQTSIANVTSKITAVAKTSDMDDVGKLLTSTIQAAKGYDPESLGKKGWFGLFKAKASEIRMRFDNVDQTVDRLVQQIDQRVALFQGRVTDIRALGEANRAYHDKLTPEIEHLLAGAQWMEDNAPAVDPLQSFSAQDRQNWLTVVDFARKRADDLRRAQLLAQQQAAQIELMEKNAISLSQKFKDIKVTTIPALKQTFTLYILNMEQKRGAEFADMVDGTANEAMQKNAALLGQNTTAIQTSLTRSNISIDTLRINHDAVINSLNEVERIRAEMKTRIAAEAPQLEQLSADLAARLAQTR